MHGDIEKVLIGRDRIAERVAELAAEVARDLRHALAPAASSAAAAAPADDHGRVVFIPVMTGALIFAADLIRQLPLKLSLELVAVSSYPGRTVESKGAQLASELPRDLAGKHVVVVDDILDSGRTLAMVVGLIRERGPASVRTAVLLDKKSRRVAQVQADYVGFDIPDAFVVGYGLDYDGHYRNLPDIAVLRADVVNGTGA